MSLGKVLVVDDDKNICELLRLYLEKDGYSVILSHDGEEAVVKFNALKPDIVLLDITVLFYTIVCYKINKFSAWLFLPYIIWLILATYLNVFIVLNNPI